MKDVSHLLAMRLKRLENPFSKEWIGDFHGLMEFCNKNSVLQRIINTIREQKEEDHQQLIHNLNQLLEEGKACLQQVLKHIRKNPNEYERINPKVQELLGIYIAEEKVHDPFFELESIFYMYYREVSSLFKEISNIDSNIFIAKYCTLSCIKLHDGVHINIDLTFSDYLSKCKQNIEVLTRRRSTSAWGKWDLLLKWAIQTKGGITPTNKPFERLLFNMFQSLKISAAVQSLGLYLLENMVDPDVEQAIKPVKAIELFLDDRNQYWIIAHFRGESDDKIPFFIKELQKKSQARALLGKLLDPSPYTKIKCDRLSHTLGELEIKKELKQVFFPSSKFVGSFASLENRDYQVDIAAVIRQLTSIEEQKRHRPYFDWGCYYRSKISAS